MANHWNPDNSVCVPFTIKGFNSLYTKLQGTTIPTISKVKYLGILLDKKLT